MRQNMRKLERWAAAMLALLLLLSSCGAQHAAEESETTEEFFVRVEIGEPHLPPPPRPEDDTITEPEGPLTILRQEKVVTGSGNLKLTVRTNLDPDKPMVALTFDDGPGKYTDGIIDLLEKYNGRGTFCVVGERLAKNTDVLNRMVEDGHEIASHTWEHTNLKKVDAATGKKAMRSVIDYIEELNGYHIRFVRPPYGGYNDTVKQEAAELGVALLRWSVDTLDWQTRDPAKTLQEVKKQTKDGAIILVHDIHAETAEAMKTVIPWLAENGYQLVTVSELLYYQNDGATAGKVYYDTY